MNKPTRKCTIEGCNTKHYARGYCRKHHARWRKHGDPHHLARYNNPEEGFTARTEQRGDCLIWTGATAPKGYGMFSLNNRMIYAHRYAWERAHGPIPDGLHIDHTCHQPNCVNVEHLRLATPGENNAHRKGPTSSNAASGARNVYRHGNRWTVQISKDGRPHWFGSYATIEEAETVAAQERANLFGEFAGNG